MEVESEGRIKLNEEAARTGVAPELWHIRRACDTRGDDEKTLSHNVVLSVSLHEV